MWAVAPGCSARSGLGRSAGALAAHLGERNEGEERERPGGDGGWKREEEPGAAAGKPEATAGLGLGIMGLMGRGG